MFAEERVSDFRLLTSMVESLNAQLDERGLEGEAAGHFQDGGDQGIVIRNFRDSIKKVHSQELKKWRDNLVDKIEKSQS